MARSEMTGFTILVLIQKITKSVLKIPAANFCRLITPQTHLGLIMADV